MSNVLFISDLHLGHSKVLEFSRDYRWGATIEEHCADLVKCWNERVTKRDTIYVLGDICFDTAYLPLLKELKGTKLLVRGNHDNILTATEWLEYFDDIFGIKSYKEYWLSHAPVHPAELRGKQNIHGHTHSKYIVESVDCFDNDLRDRRYINVCVENTGGFPVPLHLIRSGGRCWRGDKSLAYWRYK